MRPVAIPAVPAWRKQDCQSDPASRIVQRECRVNVRPGSKAAIGACGVRDPGRSAGAMVATFPREPT